MSRRIAALLGTAVGLTASGAHAQDAACRSIANDAKRLACYDKAAGTASATMPGRPNEAAAAPVRAAPGATRAPIVVVEAAARKDLDGALGARLADRWELDPGQTRGTFLHRPYKPVYVSPLVHANAVNRQPTSGNPATSATTVAPLQSTEMEFQLSVKAKLAEGLLFGYGDVWAGYTQSSRWQVYNADLSRPFRETNYEPEAMLVFGTDYKLLGLPGRMLGLGINHQSNGRGQPLSRSWNRVIAMAGSRRGRLDADVPALVAHPGIEGSRRQPGHREQPRPGGGSDLQALGPQPRVTATAAQPAQRQQLAWLRRTRLGVPDRRQPEGAGATLQRLRREPDRLQLQADPYRRGRFACRVALTGRSACCHAGRNTVASS